MYETTTNEVILGLMTENFKEKNKKKKDSNTKESKIIIIKLLMSLLSWPMPIIFFIIN
jgi:hypothetical protein